MTGLRKGIILTIAAVLAVANPAFAQPEYGDYNGDGRSDYAIALVNRSAGATAWLARHNPDNPDDLSFFTFGLPGDALVHGHWFGDNKYYPGIVFVRSIRTPLEWYIKTPQGTDLFLNYGLPGDNVVNQGDVDCDGITDLVVARHGRSNYYPGMWLWYFALSSAGGTVQELAYGLTSDRIGLGDTDGDKCMELVALRSGFVWYSKKLFEPEVTAVQWGLSGDIPLWPADGKYYIVRPDGLRQTAYIRHADGSFSTQLLGFSTAIPYLGNFSGSYGFAWNQRDTGWSAVRQPDGSDKVFQHGIAANAIIHPNGAVIQPNEDGRFAGGGDGGGGGGGGGGACTSTRQMGDVSGDLWKPVSENTGRVVLLFNRGYFSGPKKIERLYVNGANGAQVADGSFRNCCHNGNRTHWDLNKSASSLSSDAPLTIVMELQDDTVECRTVPNPRQRWE